ncbi:5'/3'-nucleotidase SurE [Eubacteriales bacterium OttesenSCG-928-M02]|nr:5'/3'-nucleotidase SurE [Eubacteriales bacterium OttesenSCG-928-M02]
MRILLVNDDGIACEGILEMAKALVIHHDVTVVAPMENRSYISHSMAVKPGTTFRVARPAIPGLEKAAVFTVSGTPCDCVHIAMTQLLSQAPDLIISGINYGDNMGSELYPSGTFNSAIAGRLYGIPAISFSCLAMDMAGGFSLAASYANQIIEAILSLDTIPDNVVFNVNYPRTLSIKGIRVSHQEKQRVSYSYHRVESIDGEDIYEFDHIHAPNDTAVSPWDRYNLINGYITITPVTLYGTDEAMVETLTPLLNADYVEGSDVLGTGRNAADR